PGFAARRAQVVEQRKQDDRDVLVAALQALQVVGQQHHAAHQHRAGVVAVGHPALLQRLGQPLHFLGHHRRGVQLHHAQGALHLVEVAGAEAHAAGVGGIGGEVLDLDPRLAQGLVQLRLDPAERGVVDRVAQSGHRSALQAGSLKSATERRRSAASCARFPMDAAVWLAPCEVCAVIDWMVFIVSVMFEAAADCCCEALEMPSISAARLVDTFSISPSAVPASSARRAPATTSEVVCSMELTASLVSAWMVSTRVSMRLVALEARSASRCTSSATTAKPRPASPADAAWMAAFSARMFVCSEMSLISSTIEPISWELSPRRLMRLEVSWIWSRMESMPAIVSRTTPAPLVAICTERCATSADS